MFIGDRVAHGGFSVGHGVTDAFPGSAIIYGNAESIADCGKRQNR